jgi:pimeloyl-ACP methyl ester carboxylesterase
MNYPIVKVTTEDDYTLHGILSEREKNKGIIIHIHGTAGNFYFSPFLQELAQTVDTLNYSFLSTNNRGSGVYNVEKGTKYTGAAIELFEECLLDIDAWVSFVLQKGYKNIILEGHSFGTNKIQYYALNGKYRSAIKALILLGFTDSYGTQLQYLNTIHRKNEEYLQEARQLMDQNKPLQILSDLYANCGELPQTAQSYFNLMSKDSALSRVIPLRKGKDLINFRKIKIPILGVVGDKNEYTVIPIQDAMKLLQSENKLATIRQIKSCTHGYTGKEKQLAEIIKRFIKDKL